jgi:inner membrane protein
MQSFTSGLARSTSIKAFVIGVLILILLIPVSMIKGVVHDRNYVHDEARADIMRSWGGEQLVTGPILVLPYRIIHRNGYGNPVVETDFAYILPAELDIDIVADPEVRYRGMHRVPIYSANMKISGSFNSPDFSRITANADDVEWGNVLVALSVSDARAIAHTPLIDVGGSVSRFKPGGTLILGDSTPPIVAAVSADLDKFRDGGALSFQLDMQLNGADALRISSLGDTTKVSMKSTWPSPSFVGGYLPEKRQVSDSGFTADWQVSSLGRQLPSQWLARDGAHNGAYQSSFGVNFYQPVSMYQLTLRAAKYAVLFIGMTFVAYFLFEVMAGMRLHPLQYLLVGFSNALFYLLLLSLAEHIGFGWSYFLSAAASVSLVSSYSATVLMSRKRGGMMALVLVALYAFLYMTLKAETYALLAGSIGLWGLLAVIMYLTRKIDWYGQAAPQEEIRF